MEDYLKDIQKDVDSMNKAFGRQAPGSESPKTDVPGTEPPGTESPSTEAPSTEAPGTDAPTTETPTTEVPEEDDKDKVIEDLRKRLEESKRPKTDAPSTKAPTTEAPLTFDPQDFFSDEEFEDIREDPKKFNELLNKLYQKAITDARRILGEGVLRSIPDIVKTNVAMTTKMQELNKKFYEDNEDLVPFKRVVAEVFEDLSSKSPNKKYDEILEDVAPKVREVLNLKEKATEEKTTIGNKSPKLPKKGKRQPGPEDKPKTTGIEAEISSMNESLRR